MEYAGTEPARWAGASLQNIGGNQKKLGGSIDNDRARLL